MNSNNQNFCDIDGVLFNKDKTEILAYAKDKIQTDYTIPDSVTSIGDSAFYYCNSLTSISIPSGVTSIGNNAFMFCNILTNISMPSGVTNIGDSAFYNCIRLTSISIPSGVTSIGDSAFYYCNSLTSISIPNSVTSIENDAFYGCVNLTDIYYGGNGAEWKEINIGRYNEYLLNATIHFNSVMTGSEGTITDFEVDVTSNVAAVQLTTVKVPDNTKVIVVTYDNRGVLVSLAETTIQNNAAQATISTQSADQLKAFVWDIKTLRPITEAKDYDL